MGAKAAPPSRILIIKTSSLGDVVCALPVLTELRELYPQARIGWVVDRRFADLLRGNPAIDELFAFAHVRVRFGPDMVSAIGEFRKGLHALAATIRREAWDIALDLQGTAKSALILRASRARLRVAEFAGMRHLPSLLSANRLVFARHAHEVKRCLEVASALGVTGDKPRFCLHITDDARRWARDQLDGLARPRLCICPGTARPEKRWDPQRFAEAARLARQGASDLAVVIVGGEGDRTAGATIASQLEDPCLDLTGRTSLQQLAAVLNECDLMLTGDTGPMHIMAALGRPVVALFGPTSPERNGPWGGGHVIVRAADRRMSTITPRQAADGVRAVLARIAPG